MIRQQRRESAEVLVIDQDINLTFPLEVQIDNISPLKWTYSCMPLYHIRFHTLMPIKMCQ